MSRFFSSRYSGLVPYTPGEQPRERKYNKLNTNESPFPPSPLAQKLAREAAGDLMLYSDPDCRSLMETACNYWNLTKEQIMFTNGSDEALNFAFMAFCDEDHPAVFPDITYSFYPVVAQLNRVPYTTIPLKEDFTLDINDYLGVGKTIFLANPNAPTGLALTRAEIEKILASNPDNVVVVDEAYVDFGAESCLNLIDQYDNLLVCQTFSKSRSLAGGRLGLCAGSPALIGDLNTLRNSCNPYNINKMTEAAGIGALLDDRYFRQNCAKIIRIREKLTADLRELGFTVLDSSANFVFAKHPGIGGLALYQSLKERGILIRHFETGRLKDYNRISVGSEEQMADFLAAVKEILEEQP